MATKSAGRVSIRVLPDSTNFRSDLKKSLDRIEKSVKAKIPVELVLDRAQLAKIKEQIESLKIKLRPDIDLSVSAEQISKLKAQIERTKPKVSIELATAAAAAEIESLTRTRELNIEAGITPESLAALEASIRDQQMNIQANLDGARANAQLATLTRPRRVSISPNINNAAMASVLAKLAGIGGLNVLGDAFRDGSNFITKIDTMMVKTAQLSLMISGVASALTSVVGNLLVAGADLMNIGKLGWLAPGFLTGTAITLGITGVALADMGNRLKDLQPRMETLKKSIQDTFWAEAEAPIRSMFENIYPRLFAPGDTKNTAAEMGKFIGEIAASIERNLPPGLLEKMFLRMNEAIAISRDAIDPLMHAFITMGEVGTRFMGRFATWIVDISNKFDDFVTKSAGNGDMERWIEDGIQALKDLGSLIGGTVRILGELTDAFRKSGAKGLGDWAKDFNSAADAMARPEFKEPLAAFFRAMRIGSDGLVDMLKNMGPGVASFVVGPLNRGMVAVAEIFRVAGSYISDVLDNPKFQRGFSLMFEGFQAGFEALAPAVKPMADSLGGVMVLLGRIAGAVGELLTTFTVMWGPQFDRLGEQIETLIDPLSLSLRQAIVNLTPLLEAFIQKVATPLIGVIRDNVLPLFDKVAQLLPAISPLFDSIKRIFEDGLGPLIDSVTDALGRMDYADLEDLFKTIGETLESIVVPAMDLFREGLDNLSAEDIKEGLETVKTIVEDVGNTIRGIVDAIKAADKFARAIDLGLKVIGGPKIKNNNEGGPIGDTVSDWNKLKDAVQWVKDFNVTIDTRDIDKAKDKFDLFIRGVKGGFKGWTEDVKDNINDIGIAANPATWGGKLKKGFRDFWEDVYKVDEFKDAIDYTPTYKGSGGKFSMIYAEDLTFLQQLHKDWDLFWTTAQLTWDTLGATLKQTWTDIGTNVALKWLEIKEGFTNWLLEIGTGWNNLWLGVSTYASTKWAEIKQGITTWMAEIGAGWNEFWLGVGLKVSETWTNIKTWISTKITEIGIGIGKFIADTKTNWSNFWLGVKTTVSTNWAEMKNNISNKINEILQKIKNWINDAKTNISNGWQNVKSTTSTAWNGIVDTIRTKIDDAINWIRRLPQRAKDALSSAGEDLRASGRSLIGGFISGMEDMISNAQATASAIMARIRNFFPFSPAKEGPFSGMGYTTHSGAALVRDFAGGMMDNMQLAREAARKVSEAANLQAQFDLDSDIGDQGITIDRRSVKVDIHNPIAEPTSKTITTASNRLTMRKK